MFKVSIELAKFAGVSIFELRKQDAEEVLYLFRCLTRFNAERPEAPEGRTVEYRNGVARVERYADEVDWFD